MRVSCHWRLKYPANIGFVSGLGMKGRANHSFQSELLCNSPPSFSKNSLAFSGLLVWMQLTKYSLDGIQRWGLKNFRHEILRSSIRVAREYVVRVSQESRTMESKNVTVSHA